MQKLTESVINSHRLKALEYCNKMYCPSLAPEYYHKMYRFSLVKTVSTASISSEYEPQHGSPGTRIGPDKRQAPSVLLREVLTMETSDMGNDRKI